jgi:hypothetical protein
VAATQDRRSRCSNARSRSSSVPAIATRCRPSFATWHPATSSWSATTSRSRPTSASSLVEQERDDLADALDDLGFLYKRRGAVARAIEVTRRALALYRELGDEKVVARFADRLDRLD